MKTFQRMIALAGVVILVGMVLATLFFAVTGSSWFMPSMILTLTLPLLIYAYLFIYRLIKGGRDREKDSDGKESGQKDSDGKKSGQKDS